MREVVKRPEFAAHSQLVEMCLDDAAEVSSQPFMELLKQEPGKDKGHWERQLTALRILERLEAGAPWELLPDLKAHPFEQVRTWLVIREMLKHAHQKTIKAEKGGYELVFIPGGTFMMGSPETEEGRFNSESPLHEVRVSDFYMGRYPVTNEEYGRFLAENKGIKEPRFWGRRGNNQARQPVVVSWHEAQAYAKWAGLQLPSEAQWEYACRARTTTRYYTGDKEEDLSRAGWYYKNSGGKLHPVGEKEPNAFGLYDMHGNVWEWVEDDWHDNYNDAPNDGNPWINNPRGSRRVLRGGCLDYSPKQCRSAYRYNPQPFLCSSFLGFRLQRS
jgi:formylglycine-generating enzyme required for sulfatase activity